ncbi:MAG: glycosyltransferase family 4 protein [Burkholderiales bacterium]
MSAQPNSPAVLSVPQSAPDRIRVAVLCDFLEENWPSMDLVGNMLFDQLSRTEFVDPERIRPAMKFRGQRPGRWARFCGRFMQYPKLARRMAGEFDIFHIVDHSYAHLVHDLPPDRAIVTCHDLDTFRCLLDPDRGRRSFAFRSMTRRILSGLQSAAHVTCNTAATRDAILLHGLVPPEQLSVVHNGVHPALSPYPDASADDALARKVGRKAGSCREILHVGSTIARKRVDVLLHMFAEVRRQRPDVRLIRVGPAFTPQQEAIANSLGVRDFIDCLDRLETRTLAACYRRASVLLQPSEAEGFGLPVIEAMACGTPVIASDIPALREVAGDAAAFCAVANLPAWSENVLQILSWDERTKQIARLASLQQASFFSWSKYAQAMGEIYDQVLSA